MARTKLNMNQINANPSLFAQRAAGSPTALGPAVVVGGYTEAFDPMGCFNPTTGIYTVPFAGKYYMAFSGFTDNAAVSGPLELQKNGVSDSRVYASQASGYNPSHISKIFDCAAGDTLRVYVGAGLVLHGSNSSMLSIMCIGA